MAISANDNATLAARGLKHGALLRPISNVVYFMPPRTRNERKSIYWWTSPWSASSTP